VGPRSGLDAATKRKEIPADPAGAIIGASCVKRTVQAFVAFPMTINVPQELC